ADDTSETADPSEEADSEKVSVDSAGEDKVLAEVDKAIQIDSATDAAHGDPVQQQPAMEPHSSMVGDIDGGMDTVFGHIAAGDLALIMAPDSDSEADVAHSAMLDQKGRELTREAAWEEYLVLDSRGSNLPRHLRPRFEDLEAFLGIDGH
ncbi:unnamed protein product, partial [Prorocentrum cordatum]